MSDIHVRIANKLLPLITRPKRLKIAVGGRGASKSVGFADAFLRFCDGGERLCCAREYQNSIDDSVHSLLKQRIYDLQGEDIRTHTLHASANQITSNSGGDIFYRGLSRNISSIKSMHGVNRMWVEEAQTLSQDTIENVLPTIREAGSEIWMSANRQISTDPFSVNFLKPYEKALKFAGYYEDDNVIIIQINYWDNPWFPAVLKQQRLRDKMVYSPAKYRHIWEGEYSDTVDNAIIMPDWFDACVDAHIKLGFQSSGIEVISFDPADGGAEAEDKGLCYRHGVIIKDLLYKRDGDVADVYDWATEYATEAKVDEFVWDGSGIGAGLRRQIDQAVLGKKIGLTMFNGAETAANPSAYYEPMDGEEHDKPRTNKDTFMNKRAQFYWNLRDRCFKTYEAVVKKKYRNPDELISFSSKIKEIDILRSEICSIPRKDNPSRIQIMSKPDMKKLKKDGKPIFLSSPAGADCVMMAFAVSPRSKKNEVINFREFSMNDRGAGY